MRRSEWKGVVLAKMRIMTPTFLSTLCLVFSLGVSLEMHGDNVILSRGYDITLPEVCDGATVVENGILISCSPDRGGRDGMVVVYPGVTNIGKRAFADCKHVTSVLLPYGLTRIDDFAFAACSSLSRLELPDTVVYIGNDAFAGCSNLTSIVMPKMLRFIGNRAFAGCKGLTRIALPNGLKTVGDNAFMGCSRLLTVKFGIEELTVSSGTSIVVSTLGNDIEPVVKLTPLGWRAYWVPVGNAAMSQQNTKECEKK